VGLVLGADPAGFGPADGFWEIVLEEGKSRPRCLTACDQQRKEATTASQVSELLKRCARIGMQPARLL